MENEGPPRGNFIDQPPHYVCGVYPQGGELLKNDVRSKTYVPRGTFFKNLRKNENVGES
jgi:hypothetical protein